MSVKKIFTIVERLEKDANRYYQMHLKNGDLTNLCNYYDGQRDVLIKVKRRVSDMLRKEASKKSKLKIVHESKTN